MKAYGIMGGTFDPIHNGHLLMADFAMNQLGLDEVLFIPDGDPPHKKGLSPAQDRLNMVRQAIAGQKKFCAVDMEVRREGVTYTVDTLEHLRKEHPLTDRFFYIVGADTLMALETWRDFPRVSRLLAGIACAPRKEFSPKSLRQQRAYIFERYNLRVDLLDMEPVDLSSTQVRNRVARGLPVEGMLPAPVAKYITEHELYLDPLFVRLQKTLSKERYRHTLGVEEVAVKLARHYGEDIEKARMAALLHDCARCIDSARMRRLVGDRAGKSALRALMHAPAGEALARQEYGITDEQVLSAIRWHTTGREGMTKLEKIVYLADIIEPNRQAYPGLDALREAAFRDLDEAVRMAAVSTMRYVRARGLSPDENTIRMLKSDQATEEIL